jgi:hypothetical protein
MLFVAEYAFAWDALATVAAKRLEWDAAQPDGFRFVGEWVWKDREPAFRGVAVIEAEDVEALNAFALHYGTTLTMTFHPVSDVMSALTQIGVRPQVRLVSRRPRAKRGA